MGKKQLVETSHIVADFGQLIPSYLVALIFGDLGCALGAIPALLIGHDDRPEPPPSRRFLSLMMDNFIFSLGLVVRTVDTSAQAGLWVLSADWWSTTGAMMRIMAA